MCVCGGGGARRERDRKAPGVDQSSDRSVTARGDDIDSPTHVDVLNLGRDHFSALAALTHNVAYVLEHANDRVLEHANDLGLLSHFVAGHTERRSVQYKVQPL